MIVGQRRYFCFRDELEAPYVAHIGRVTRTRCTALRLLLALVICLSFRKVRSGSIIRYDVALAIWLFGAAVQLVFAAQLQLQKDFLQHERMKAYQYLVSLCVVMVASMLLNEVTARACLATALHGYILHGGYLLFDQIRLPSQLQLQGFQILAFGFVQVTEFLDARQSSSVATVVVENVILVPLAVVAQLVIGAVLEARARADFLRRQGKPESELGAFWQRVLPACRRLRLGGCGEAYTGQTGAHSLAAKPRASAKRTPPLAHAR